MPVINILFKNNSTPMGISLTSEEDAQKLMDDIIEKRGNPKIKTLLVFTQDTFGFIDPHEIASCVLQGVTNKKE